MTRSDAGLNKHDTTDKSCQTNPDVRTIKYLLKRDERNGILNFKATEPMTGYWRNGCCDTGPEDQGRHTVCAIMTAEFLALSKYLGNDLTTPRPEFGFPGLKPGDGWCLVAARFLQAHEEGAAPQVRLAATHLRTLDIVPLEVLKAYATED